MKITKNINKKYALHRLLGLLLIAALIGVSPGIFDNIAYNALPVATVHADQSAKTIFSVQTNQQATAEDKTESGTAQISETAIEKDLEASKAEEEKIAKEMSKLEEIAWSVGKALLPTLAVMALSAALVCPLGWVVVGAVLAGAATSAIITYAYEKRKNSFRTAENKKPDSEILKEVSINAAISGALAPFNMLTGGMLQTIGPLTAKTIVTSAVKAGAVSFAGSTVSNVVKAGVTNLWYDHYYNYDEKEAELKSKIKNLYLKGTLTSSEEAELVACLEELDTITKKKYTIDNFIQDEKSALASAAISGILGGIAGRFGAETKLAKTVSSKLFGTTSKANLISNAVISNPFAFASGAASAQIQKESIIKKIEDYRLEQLRYEEGSNAWNYYEAEITELENSYMSIKLSDAGKNAMISNASTQLAMVSVSLAKTRLIDMPAEKAKKVQSTYESESEEWKKADNIRQQLEIKKSLKPKPSDFATRREYTAALRDYSQELGDLKNAYTAAKAEAAASQNSPENKELIKEIKKEVEAEIEFNREAELAKSLGRESYIEFKMKNLASKEENAGKSPAEIREMAQDEVTKGYFKAAEKSNAKIEQMEKKLDVQTSELFGSLEEGDDGKTYVVVRDEHGQVLKQTQFKYGDAASFKDKMFSTTTEELQRAEVENIVRQVYNSSSMVKPSAYRNEYVNMKVNEMRGQGYSEAQIDKNLSAIVKEANTKTYNQFGNSWENIAKAEILAAGLERAKYDDGAAPTIDKVVTFVKSTLSSKTVSTVQSEFSGGVKTAIDVTGLSEVKPFYVPVLDSDKRNEETLKKVYRNVDRQYNRLYDFDGY